MAHEEQEWRATVLGGVSGGVQAALGEQRLETEHGPCALGPCALGPPAPSAQMESGGSMSLTPPSPPGRAGPRHTAGTPSAHRT